MAIACEVWTLSGQVANVDHCFKVQLWNGSAMGRLVVPAVLQWSTRSRLGNNPPR